MIQRINNFRLAREGWWNAAMIIFSVVLIVALGNQGFHEKLLTIYPLNTGDNGFLLSFFLFHCALLIIVIALLAVIFPMWLVISFFTLLAATAGYFIDHYGAIIDTDMLRNVFSTDVAEVRGLINTPLILQVVLIGLAPAFIVRLALHRQSYQQRLIQSCVLIATAGIVMTGCATFFGGQYADLFREHRTVRFYANPTYPFYAMASYGTAMMRTKQQSELSPRLLDAHIPKTDQGFELVIVVVGETARRDRFSLNGYLRDTNPRLSQIPNLFSYQNVTSCGTSTAYSVPCMFAIEGADDFDPDDALHTENVLDVLQRAGVSVLWRDNNSNSKGVADRVPYESFRHSSVNPVCDIECRDVGMLAGLQAYINQQSGDILIVLHQMGNHGPEYYKRYPTYSDNSSQHARTAELNRCSTKKLTTTYDNAILYTDHFLAGVINCFGKCRKFETSMLYISDRQVMGKMVFAMDSNIVRQANKPRFR